MKGIWSGRAAPTMSIKLAAIGLLLLVVFVSGNSPAQQLARAGMCPDDEPLVKPECPEVLQLKEEDLPRPPPPCESATGIDSADALQASPVSLSEGEPVLIDQIKIINRDSNYRRTCPIIAIEDLRK